MAREKTEKARWARWARWAREKSDSARLQCRDKFRSTDNPIKNVKVVFDNTNVRNLFVVLTKESKNTFDHKNGNNNKHRKVCNTIRCGFKKTIIHPSNYYLSNEKIIATITRCIKPNKTVAASLPNLIRSGGVTLSLGDDFPPFQISARFLPPLCGQM